MFVAFAALAVLLAAGMPMGIPAFSRLTSGMERVYSEEGETEASSL